MAAAPDPEPGEATPDEDPQVLASLRRGLAQHAAGDVMERDDLGHEE